MSRRRARRSLVWWAGVVRDFYQWPVAWAGLLVTSVLLTFGGGAVMFWFHAIVRGERGPAIGDVHHWLLDATLGFVGLTPLLALIVPFGVLAASGSGGTARGRGKELVYVLAVAALFTVTTGPGPFLHNLVAGDDTPLADLAVRLFGEDPAVSARNQHVHQRSAVAEGLLQVLIGLPVYVVCTWLALRLVQAMSRGVRRAPGRAPGSRLSGGGRPSSGGRSAAA